MRSGIYHLMAMLQNLYHASEPFRTCAQTLNDNVLLKKAMLGDVKPHLLAKLQRKLKLILTNKEIITSLSLSLSLKKSKGRVLCQSG